MYIVFLTFSSNRDRLDALMDAHNAWIRAAFDDGIFLLAGSLTPGRGGCILARGVDRDTLDTLIDQDPFVKEGVVVPEIHEIDPKKADERLQFLLA